MSRCRPSSASSLNTTLNDPRYERGIVADSNFDTTVASRTSSLCTVVFVGHVLLRLVELGVLFFAGGVLVFLEAFPFLLDLLGHKALIVLERLLDVHLELDDVVQDALDLGVELLAQDISSRLQLFIPVFESVMPETRLEGEYLLDGGVHLPLLHQLDVLTQAGAHLRQLLLHLLNLRV